VVGFWIAVSPLDALSAPPSAPRPPASRVAAAALLVQTNARLSLPVWRAGELASEPLPTGTTGWPALDAVLPGGGWPLAGLTELLGAPASGELELLAPWLRRLSTPEAPAPRLLWIAPPGVPCAAALQALGLAWPQLVTVTPANAADAAWAAEQALRSGSCAAVLLWCHGTGHVASQSARQAPAFASTGLRRLHLAAQAGRTPLMALRPLSARTQSSPAPLRLACVPGAGRRLAVEVFKRRGPPLAEPIQLGLPWPLAVRRSFKHTALTLPHAVDGPAPAAPAAASPALVATGA
jgi:protein ImuA